MAVRRLLGLPSSEGRTALDIQDGILSHMSGMAGTLFSTQPLPMTCSGFLAEWQSQGNTTSYMASSFAYCEHFKGQETETARLVKGNKWNCHSVPSTELYWSEQSQGPPPFKMQK